VPRTIADDDILIGLPPEVRVGDLLEIRSEPTGFRIGDLPEPPWPRVGDLLPEPRSGDLPELRAGDLPPELRSGEFPEVRAGDLLPDLRVGGGGSRPAGLALGFVLEPGDTLTLIG